MTCRRTPLIGVLVASLSAGCTTGGSTTFPSSHGTAATQSTARRTGGFGWPGTGEHHFTPLEQRTIRWASTPLANRTSQTALDYVSDIYDGTVTAYDPATHAQVAQITGLARPSGLRYDGKFLYVAEYAGEDILAFPSGSGTPSKMHTRLDYNAQPGAIAVAGDGTMYVANAVTGNTFGPSNVAVYAPGARTPTAFISYQIGDGIVALTLDHSGNLYVASTNGIVEFAPGQYSGGKNLNLSLPGLPQGLVFDKGDANLIVTISNQRLAVFPRGKTSPSQVVTLPNDAWYPAFDRTYQNLIVPGVDDATIDGIVDFWSYPSLTSTGQVRSTPGFGLGATTDPPAPY